MNISGSKKINISIYDFIPALIILVFIIFAFTLFISAITMCVAALAKTYKEANNYITPLTLCIMLIGYIGFIPNIKLTNTMALIPVANICILIKSLLLFKINYTAIILVFLSNIIYAMLAISILSGIYDSEAVLFDEGKGRMQLFERRKNIKRGGIIKTGDTWFLIVFVILAVIYAGGIFEMKYGLFGVFLTQMLILFIPLSVLVYTKKDLRKNYSVRKTKPLNVLYSFIFMAGIFLLNIPLTTFVTSVFPDNTKTVTDSLQSIMGSGFLVTVLVVCIVPGICEELFFRGVIFSSMKERYKPVTAIIITAACFGIYHTSIVRFFPTAFLGASLCIICYYTGSVFPGIIMHSLNNLTSKIEKNRGVFMQVFNPFMERPLPFDKIFMDWNMMYPKSYNKNTVNAYTKTRIILMNGTEFEAQWFSRNFARHCINNDIRRDLAMIRRSEQQQQKRIACLKPKDETALEHTIGYEQLAVDLTAVLAKKEENCNVRNALILALLEDFDHLYRYSNLLNLEYGVYPEKLVGGYTEIMPARPTISEHRYPKDSIFNYTYD